MVGCVAEADDKLMLLSIALSLDEQLMALLEERKADAIPPSKSAKDYVMPSD